MQHGKIIMQEAETVIQRAGSYVILLTYSRLCQSSVQCLHCLVFDERFYERFWMFYFNFSQRFYRAMHYSAKRGLAIACRLPVCLSVCLWHWWIM